MNATRLAIGAAALCAAIGCGRSPEAGNGDATALIVAPDRVARAEVKRLEAGVPFTGELRPNLSVTVKAQIDGDLEAVLVREGERVRAGQPLARYEPGDTRDRHVTAEADLLAARSAAIAAQGDLRRIERLLKAGAASPSELEMAQAASEAAAARERLAEAAFNRATDDLARLDVPSPFAGEVSQRLVHPGDHVAIGDPLVQIVDTETLELAATIPADALARVRTGSPVRFQVDAFPDRVFSGEVARVNPVTEPGTRQVQIYARLANKDRALVGGLFASGRVIDTTVESAIAVPIAALRQEDGMSAIYVLRGGKTVRVPVTTGLADEAAGLVQVKGELAAGDSLLVGSVPGLKAGLDVRLSGGEGR
jgi:RND family efflux transporter MFP subunit